MNRLKNHIIVYAILILTACASPATNMTQEEISSLSNTQLCQLKNNYLWDQKTEIEIGHRNLNCDPVYNECLLRGADPDSSEMALCIQKIRENQALQQQLAKQQRQLEAERRRNQAQAQTYFCPGFPYCK